MVLKEKSKQKKTWLHWNMAGRFRELDQNRTSSTVRIRLPILYRVITQGLQSTVQEEKEEKNKRGAVGGVQSEAKPQRHHTVAIGRESSQRT